MSLKLLQNLNHKMVFPESGKSVTKRMLKVSFIKKKKRAGMCMVTDFFIISHFHDRRTVTCKSGIADVQQFCEEKKTNSRLGEHLTFIVAHKTESPQMRL